MKNRVPMPMSYFRWIENIICQIKIDSGQEPLGFNLVLDEFQNPVCIETKVLGKTYRIPMMEEFDKKYID